MTLVPSTVTEDGEDQADRVKVLSVDWSPDKRRIVAGRSDGSIQIWNLPTEKKTPVSP
ncbi:MAG: hypothetical protein GWN46_13505 [Gammaproteobacteria bacterium]|nr:hypothetical protein [Gammaproteobacteria bacterium]